MKFRGCQLMSKSKNNGALPRLRFPEFEKDKPWKQKLFESYCLKISSGKDSSQKDGEYDLYGSTGIIGKTTSASYKGDYLLIARVGANAGLITKAKGIFGVTDNTLVIILKEPEKIGFVFYLLESYGLDKLVFGSGQPLITSKLLKSINVGCPIKDDEQQKIADCLSSVDELISAQKQKLETLKDHKKGLMQQLFPAEGETVPKLRFPEFNHNWNKQKTSDLLTRVLKPVEIEPAKWYRQIGIRSHGKGIFYKDDVTGKELGAKRVFWVEGNVFIVNIVFAWELAVASTTIEHKGTIASHRFPMYRPRDNKSDVRYMKYFFLTHKGKELLWIASPGGAGRNKTLGQKDFENLEFLSPNVKEQQKIADCLSSLDDLISTQNQKIELLQAHKKGLMQQLFPAVDEVSA